MSARSVCSGTRPSRYPSERDISAPPSRPEHCTCISFAPGTSCEFCTTRSSRGGRRSGHRSARRCSGPPAVPRVRRLDLYVLEGHLLPGDLLEVREHRSTSAPLRRSRCPDGPCGCRPRPARGALDLDLGDARPLGLAHESRISMSSCQVPLVRPSPRTTAFQSVMIPRRNPYGFIFWPIIGSPAPIEPRPPPPPHVLSLVLLWCRAFLTISACRDIALGAHDGTWRPLDDPVRRPFARGMTGWRRRPWSTDEWVDYSESRSEVGGSSRSQTADFERPCDRLGRGIRREPEDVGRPRALCAPRTRSTARRTASIGEHAEVPRASRRRLVVFRSPWLAMLSLSYLKSWCCFDLLSEPAVLALSSPSDRGRSASERTRPACGRPSPP